MRAKTICIAAFLALTAMLFTSCSADTRSFAEAHDAFTTTLVEQLNDQDEIPAPPEGVFDLVYYDTKAGKLAAYASSDPGDGQKHPMMIWIVGGWGYGIDEFPWTYPEWDNDQTGSAFYQAGILMMYPSFRGAHGNPGYYETVFGEIDDIAAAYDYAASLPYVDPDRIYLGGHSTGGTKALLASEYTDKFRAVFSFGPVDHIKYHNTSQFTFDTEIGAEYKLRSPIYWLADIKTPTFIIEGEEGNAERVKALEKATDNPDVHCYVIEDEDHYSVLAPITRLAAEKILSDTGADCNVTLTAQELRSAMDAPPPVPLPITRPYANEELGLSFAYPAIWEIEYDDSGLWFYSIYDEDNFWDTSTMYMELYELEEPFSFVDFTEFLNSDGEGYQTATATIHGREFFVGEANVRDSDGRRFFNKTVAIQEHDLLIFLWMYSPEDFTDDADLLFENIIDSLVWA